MPGVGRAVGYPGTEEGIEDDPVTAPVLPLEIAVLDISTLLAELEDV